MIQRLGYLPWKPPSLAAALVVVWALSAACDQASDETVDVGSETDIDMEKRLEKYTTVRLTADVDSLEDWERQVLSHLLRAASAIDRSYWKQAYGEPAPLLDSLESDGARRFAEINFGPWDRLADNEAFIPGADEKPPGANFYPADMTRDEFELASEETPELESLYTMVRREEDGRLVAIPYSDFFADEFGEAADQLRRAAGVAQDESLRRYLSERADAFETNQYQQSDMAWMDMKDNRLDVVIGPIETYEDQLFGYKAANEAFVLIKDMEWSERLSRYVTLLPGLQRELPVDEAYKQEKPGLEAELNAYDVIFYAGDANAGSKAIAVNLPNDEGVQLEKGTRRLQLKNAMRAKFDKILIPIADNVIASSQRANIAFDAFFSNVMFHEVAHGLGIKNTLDGTTSVRQALKERASALEEAKADVLGLFMITRLIERGDLDSKIEDHYVTFLASIFRSVRFGGASAHGRANLMQLNFLNESKAFMFHAEDQSYSVDIEVMKDAVDELAGRILTFQGDGDYDGLGTFMERYGERGPGLSATLERVSELGIPVDVVFEQGGSVLGLQ